jgi:hypothetical protein
MRGDHQERHRRHLQLHVPSGAPPTPARRFLLAAELPYPSRSSHVLGCGGPLAVRRAPQCRAEGFLGSSDPGWRLESLDSQPLGPPPASESESGSESSDEGEPAEKGVRFGRVDYDNGGCFWGELHDGNEYIGALHAPAPAKQQGGSRGKIKMVKFVDGSASSSSSVPPRSCPASRPAGRSTHTASTLAR